MSDVNNPLTTLHEMALKLKTNLKQSREWIDFMKDARQDTTQMEIDYKNTLAKYENWAVALRAKGYTDL